MNLFLGLMRMEAAHSEDDISIILAVLCLRMLEAY
jgi:hypothetical protein